MTQRLKMPLSSLLQRGALLAIAALFLSTTVLSTVVSAEKTDTGYFSGQDIIYYDPNAVACASHSSATTDASKITGSDVAEKVFNFLTTTKFKAMGDKAFSSIQAAGALGNFEEESMMDPTAIQPGDLAYGLAQWDSVRKIRLLGFAKQKSADWKDLALQFEYMKFELNTDGYIIKQMKDSGFLNATTPAEAAMSFEAGYEDAGKPRHSDRIASAVKYYGRFANSAGQVGPVGTVATVGGCRYTNTGPVGDYMSDSFISYAQCATSTGGGAWGNKTNIYGQKMCAVGCGPTAVAMVIRNMSGTNITPDDTRNYYNKSGAWSSFGSGPDAMRKAAKSWGLRTEPMNPRNLDDYKKIFAAGGLVVIGGQGAEPFYSNFGHYVVVRGITEDGKFRVSDPGRGLVKDYSISGLMAGAANRANNATAFYTK